MLKSTLAGSQMILSLMYMAIGFLFAALTLVAVIPSIHDRAVRLTTSRLRATLPQSMEEIEAHKDLLRAEFAMSTCRFEKWLEQLKHKSADQLVELGKRADVINRLKIDRGTLKVELAETNALLEALKADKNSLRSEFAISTCRIEKSVEQLKHKSTDQVVELDKRAGVINRLKIERDALKVELTKLNAQLEVLKQRPIASSERGTAKATRARSSRGRLAVDSA
jgi:chromosome segregation ATPase